MLQQDNQRQDDSNQSLSGNFSPQSRNQLRSAQEEIDSVIHDYGAKTSLLSEAHWDGSKLTLHSPGGKTPFFQQHLQLPPDIKLEILHDTIIQISDTQGGSFYETSSGSPASFEELLSHAAGLSAFNYMFLVSLPFHSPQSPAIEANLYAERYPSLPHAAHRASHGSGVPNDDIQEFLDTTLRELLREQDLVKRTTSFPTPIGPLEVIGPNRYGEVLLSTSDTSISKDDNFRFFYNLANDTLSIEFLGLTTIQSIQGSFKAHPAEFVFTTPTQGWLPGLIDYDTEYRVKLNPQSQSPYDTIILERV